MAEIDTVNYFWTKPEIGASADSWGDTWNDNLDSIDTDLKAVEGKAEAAQEDADASLKTANKLSELSGVAADARTNIGAQQSNAKLTSLAGLAGAADKFPYLTGENAFALASISEAGRNFLTDTDAAAQRSRLGLVGARDVLIYIQAGDPGGASGALWIW